MQGVSSTSTSSSIASSCKNCQRCSWSPYPQAFPHRRHVFLRPRTAFLPSNRTSLRPLPPTRAKASGGRVPMIASSSLKALVFDCDGVILESEDLHRRAYNAAFTHFSVVCPGSSEPLEWSSHFYDQLQNQVGGGKPKMRWYFKTYGWPSSTICSSAPESDSDRDILIDTLQDWKTEKYKSILASGIVKPRPGVIEMMDEAQAKGLKVAVCSAATKSSVIFALNSLIGKRLMVPAAQCLVVEDSVIGLQAALGADMSCVISYTSSTAEQDFTGACAVYADLGSVRLHHLLELMEKNVTVM